MFFIKFFFSISLIISITLLFKCIAISAETPQEQVRQTIEGVIDILKDESLKKPNKTEERRIKLRNTVGERFDYDEMAKRSLGIQWQKITPKERKEFIALFGELLERSYINKIESYTDEKILYMDASVEEEYSVVRTKIITKRNLEIPIDYKLMKAGKQWKVYDVVIEGVSLVSNYRSQFSRIIRSHSYSELVKRLKAKKEEIIYEEKAK